MDTDSVLLDPTVVEQIFVDCLFKAGEDTSIAVMVNGIVNKFGFHPDRLASHREEIACLLAELPDSFKQSGGRGDSFLHACIDRYGNQWTGLHQTVEQLMALGLATDQVEYCVPPDQWRMLPGSMPIFMVKHSNTTETEAPTTSDEQTNAVRDSLIASSPQHESLIRTRDEVVERWCKEHGVTKDGISMEQLLEIRALPEWQNAS